MLLWCGMLPFHVALCFVTSIDLRPPLIVVLITPLQSYVTGCFKLSLKLPRGEGETERGEGGEREGGRERDKRGMCVSVDVCKCLLSRKVAQRQGANPVFGTAVTAMFAAS